MTTDEQAEAERLYKSYVHHGRVFVGARQIDGRYAVETRAVETLRQPSFRFLYEFWGVERDVMAQQVGQYNDQIANNKPCVTARELLGICINAAGDQFRVESLRLLAAVARNDGKRAVSDAMWLIWRLQKMTEWGDHAGLEALLGKWAQSSDLLNKVTSHSHHWWATSAAREAGVALTAV